MSDVVVFGSFNADHVLQVPRFPAAGETLMGHHYSVVAGGKGANQALAATRLRASVSFIASVGDDAFSHTIMAQYHQEGMDIRAVKRQAEMSSGIAMIWVNQEGENCICLSSEANACLLDSVLTDQDEAMIKKARYLLVQLETPLSGVAHAMHLAKAAGVKVVLNPAPAQILPEALFTCVSILTPNETEVEILTGIQVKDTVSAQKAADVLHDKGIPCVIITRGSQGAWVSESGVGYTVPAFRVANLVDSTAAGDTFNGALVSALLQNKTLQEAVRFANAAAAIAVTRSGAQPSIPTYTEVAQFLQSAPSV